MAVGNTTTAKYFSISQGKVTRQFKQPTPNTKSRVNKRGVTVHEEFYDYIDGRIAAVEVKVSKIKEYGRQWMILLIDGEERQVIQLPYSSASASAFLKILPNVDLMKRVKIIPTAKEENGKTKYGLFIFQDGNAVKWYYTRENPRGLPEMRKVKIKGEEQWDDSDMMEFLENMVKTEIQPLLKDIADGGSLEPDDQLPEGEDLPGDGEKPEEKLPF